MNTNRVSSESPCLVCGNGVSSFLDLGKMPIANGFLLERDFAKETFYNLSLGFCDNCKMVQLLDRLLPEQMFHEQYPFFTSSSCGMVQHFESFAGNLIESLADSLDPFVVEIGSNDGVLLGPFSDAGIRHLGVEPSTNVAERSMFRNVNTMSSFFNRESAEKIVMKQGKADIIVATNVMCHIEDIHSAFEGVRILLKEDGQFIFEDPYWGDIVEKTSFDQIYDEHIFYFSAHSVDQVCQRHGLVLLDVLPQSVHGGSMRYVVGHAEGKSPTTRVEECLREESSKGLVTLSTQLAFAENVAKVASELRAILTEARSERRRVVGYGATSKSTTLLNYCGIGPDLIEAIYDTTPEKQFKFSPGAHIPIRPYSEFSNDYPDMALLLAWNHSDEIMSKETGFVEHGGQWIHYVPKVQVLETAAAAAN